MLRTCILNAKNQSYVDFIHSIGIMHDGEIINYECLYDDVFDNRFIVEYRRNASTHVNAMGTIAHAISRCASPFDIYIKIDDDDIYKRDYVKTIVKFFETHNCDILSSKIGFQLNNHFLSIGDYHNLGGDFPHNNFLMPQTYAFSHKAYEIICGIKDDGNFDDLQWRYAWVTKGLSDHNVDNSGNIVWHIHGRNASVGDWFRRD